MSPSPDRILGMGGYRALDRVEECVGLFLVDVIHNNYTYAHVRKIFSVLLVRKIFTFANSWSTFLQPSS